MILSLLSDSTSLWIIPEPVSSSLKVSISCWAQELPPALPQPFTSHGAQLTSLCPRGAFLDPPPHTPDATPCQRPILLCTPASTICTHTFSGAIICSLFVSPTVCKFHKNRCSILFTTLFSMLSKVPGAQEIISKQINAQ